MKQTNKKRKGWIFGLLLLGVTIQVSAQTRDTLYVNSPSSTLAAFDLEKVEKITFTEQDFSIYDTDGTPTVTSFDDLGVLSFVRLFADGNKTDIAAVEVKNVEVKVYPNPVVDYLNVESTSGIHDIRVFSQTGALLLHQKQLGASVTLSFSTLPVGIYLLRVETEAGIGVQKIIKQ
jgi:hypothetical protein